MTAVQRQMILNLLTALFSVATMDQVNTIWDSLERAAKSYGFNVGQRPRSVTQARSTANSLRNRL